MDLQAANVAGGRRWSAAKLAALACFLLAGGLLVGSLVSAKAALLVKPELSLTSEFSGRSH